MRRYLFLMGLFVAALAFSVIPVGVKDPGSVIFAVTEKPLSAEHLEKLADCGGTKNCFQLLLKLKSKLKTYFSKMIMLKSNIQQRKGSRIHEWKSILDFTSDCLC